MRRRRPAPAPGALAAPPAAEPRGDERKTSAARTSWSPRHSAGTSAARGRASAAPPAAAAVDAAANTDTTRSFPATAGSPGSRRLRMAMNRPCGGGGGGGGGGEEQEEGEGDTPTAPGPGPEQASIRAAPASHGNGSAGRNRSLIRASIVTCNTPAWHRCWCAYIRLSCWAVVFWCFGVMVYGATS